MELNKKIEKYIKNKLDSYAQKYGVCRTGSRNADRSNQSQQIPCSVEWIPCSGKEIPCFRRSREWGRKLLNLLGDRLPNHANEALIVRSLQEFPVNLPAVRECLDRRRMCG